VVEELLPTQCECGAVLVKEGAQVLEVRQEFDIPPPKLVVREYRKLGCACGVCGRHNEGGISFGDKSTGSIWHWGTNVSGTTGNSVQSADEKDTATFS
jgi:hypothetical protein